MRNKGVEILKDEIRKKRNLAKEDILNKRRKIANEFTDSEGKTIYDYLSEKEKPTGERQAVLDKIGMPRSF